MVLRTVALDGLEGRILRRLTADKHATSVGTDVYQAVRAIVPESRDPFGAAVSLPLDDIIAAGYLIKVPRSGGFGARLTGRPKWTIAAVPERYPELTDRVEALAQAWRAFLTDPAYHAICDAVRRAIQSRRESDTDGLESDTGGLD